MNQVTGHMPQEPLKRVGTSHPALAKRAVPVLNDLQRRGFEVNYKELPSKPYTDVSTVRNARAGRWRLCLGQTAAADFEFNSRVLGFFQHCAQWLAGKIRDFDASSDVEDNSSTFVCCCRSRGR